jgi:hypothetical protein
MLAAGTPVLRVILALGSSAETEAGKRLVRRYLMVVYALDENAEEERRMDHLKVPGAISNVWPEKLPLAACSWNANSCSTADSPAVAE